MQMFDTQDGRKLRQTREAQKTLNLVLWTLVAVERKHVDFG
jgi:hypothetical protein